MNRATVEKQVRDLPRAAELVRNDTCHAFALAAELHVPALSVR